MSRTSLVARRKELVARCAEQRTGLAYELRALRPASVLARHPLAGYALANRKLVLGMLGATLGLALARRKRLPGLLGSAGFAIRAWKTAQGLLGMLARRPG